jgi:hypothetical protein
MEKTTNKGAFQRLFSYANFKAKNSYRQAILDRISCCHTLALGYHCYQCNNEDCQHTHTQYHSVGTGTVRFVVRSKKTNG